MTWSEFAGVQMHRGYVIKDPEISLSDLNITKTYTDIFDHMGVSWKHHTKGEDARCERLHIVYAIYLQV